MRANTRKKHLKKLQKYRKYKQRKVIMRQHGGFINRYDFVYAGEGTVNQAMKGLDSLTPKLINQTSREIDKIAGGENKTGHKQWRATNSKNRTTNYSRSYQGHLQTTVQATRKPWHEKICSTKKKTVKNKD